MKILLIDDSKTMRGLQRGILAELGYTEIEEAFDGLDALEKVDAYGPDLLLLDWSMPNMDGLSFVEAYRKAGGLTPIIMMPTESEKVRVVEAIRAGVNNYVVKPFTAERLSERIRETMAHSSAA